jgi:hypothetical protein
MATMSNVIIKSKSRPTELDLSNIKNNSELYLESSSGCFSKDSFIDIIESIDEAVHSKLYDYERIQLIATKSAIEMHNQWRKVYIQQYGNIPRIKKLKDGMDFDINVEGDLLNPEFLEFNYNMALFVATYMIFYKYPCIETTAAVIHNKWLQMSPWARGGNLDILYSLLPDIEKEKDRDIYRIVNSFNN